MNITISVSTLKNIIQRLNLGMGHDNIHSSFLKKVSDQFLNYIVCFLNACFCHCYIPGELLKGDINPTIKDAKGNCSDSGNYRPVMQSSCLLKVLEIHILDILEEKIHFNFRKFGFKKGASTTDACYILKEVIHRYLKGKGNVFSAFIDLSKAFDKVDHFILGNILMDKDIPLDIVILIMHYLRNQSARILWDGEFGEYHAINEGVRQGGILSPFLFKLYIDSVIKEIGNLEMGCRLGFLRINILAYADDIVIIGDTLHTLQKIYCKLVHNLDNLKLILNKNKTKCIIFDSSRYGNNVKEITLGNDTLECVTEYKYLGHIIQRNLEDTKDVQSKLNQFYSKFNIVYRKFKNVSVNTLFFLFNSYCLPEYGLALWDITEISKKHVFKVFRTAFHNSMKKISGATFYHSSHDVATNYNQLLLEHYLALVQSRYIKRINKSKNSIMVLGRPYLKAGYHMKRVFSHIKDNYEMKILENDLDVIKARLFWKQRNENSTGLRFSSEL